MLSSFKFDLSSQIRFLGAASAVLFLGVIVAIPGLASATTITATATSFSGSSLSVTATIDDSVVANSLVITLVVEDGGSLADLRGFFVDITADSLPASFEVMGPEVTSSVFDKNNVIDLGLGNNLNGDGTPCPCDFGVEFGNPGIAGGDDFQSVTFILLNVSLSLFKDQVFGVRATSVGSESSREASSKLKGRFSVVPEPSTAILMLIGLTGLSFAGSRAARQDLNPDPPAC